MIHCRINKYSIQMQFFTHPSIWILIRKKSTYGTEYCLILFSINQIIPHGIRIKDTNTKEKESIFIFINCMLIFFILQRIKINPSIIEILENLNIKLSEDKLISNNNNVDKKKLAKNELQLKQQQKAMMNNKGRIRPKV